MATDCALLRHLYPELASTECCIRCAEQNTTHILLIRSQRFIACCALASMTIAKDIGVVVIDATALSIVTRAF